MKKMILLLVNIVLLQTQSTSCMEAEVIKHESKENIKNEYLSSILQEDDRLLSLLENFMNGKLRVVGSMVHFSSICDKQKKYEENFEEIQEFLTEIHGQIKWMEMGWQVTPILTEVVISKHQGPERRIEAFSRLLSHQGITELQLRRFQDFMSDPVTEKEKSKLVDGLIKFKNKHEKKYKKEFVDKSIEEAADYIIEKDSVKMKLRSLFAANTIEGINDACEQLERFNFVSLTEFLKKIDKKLTKLRGK